MKRKTQQLRLNRETLRHLESGEARRAAGAATDIATNCPGLCISVHPVNCVQTRHCTETATVYCPPPTNPC